MIHVNWITTHRLKNKNFDYFCCYLLPTIEIYRESFFDADDDIPGFEINFAWLFWQLSIDVSDMLTWLEKNK